MPFEITQVDDRTQKLLLNIAESYTADLKAIEVAPSRLTKSLSAFCNADGGELFIGVDEDKTTGARGSGTRSRRRSGTPTSCPRS